MVEKRQKKVEFYKNSTNDVTKMTSLFIKPILDIQSFFFYLQTSVFCSFIFPLFLFNFFLIFSFLSPFFVSFVVVLFLCVFL